MTLAPLPTSLPPGYCNLNFDPTTASEELFLFKETHSVLNLGILLEDVTAAGGPFAGFKQWPQVLCSRGLSEGRHYWEVEVSNSWVCLGVTYRHRPTLSGRPRRNIVHLLGRNPYSWCLEWDSLKFSVWHNNTQTVLHGSYHRSLGVALGCGAGCLLLRRGGRPEPPLPLPRPLPGAALPRGHGQQRRLRHAQAAPGA